MTETAATVAVAETVAAETAEVVAAETAETVAAETAEIAVEAANDAAETVAEAESARSSAELLDAVNDVISAMAARIEGIETWMQTMLLQSTLAQSPPTLDRSDASPEGHQSSETPEISEAPAETPPETPPETMPETPPETSHVEPERRKLRRF